MAHVRRLAKEVMVEIEAAAVHENSVHPLDFGSTRRQPRKEMNVMAKRSQSAA
jgi:hypothetical protein